MKPLNSVSHRRHVGLTRVLQLIERLKAGRRTLRDLSVEYAVSERTIRRDLATLSCVGVQIRTDTDREAGPGERGVWWIEA